MGTARQVLFAARHHPEVAGDRVARPATDGGKIIGGHIGRAGFAATRHGNSITQGLVGLATCDNNTRNIARIAAAKVWHALGKGGRIGGKIRHKPGQPVGLHGVLRSGTGRDRLAGR